MQLWSFYNLAVNIFEAIRLPVFSNFVLIDRCEPFHVDSETGVLSLNASHFCSSNRMRDISLEYAQQDDVLSVYWDTGDFISWDIDLEEEGTYWVHYRFASPEGSGWFELSTSTSDHDESRITENSIPAAGDWQSWSTIQQPMQLPSGRQSITLTVLEGGWDIHILEIELESFVIQSESTDHRALSSTGYVRTDGKQILDQYGSPILLQGMGLGGWMLQEPYMVLFNNVSTQWEMFEELGDLIGEEGLQAYRQAWLDNWMTFDDVVALKKSGFNSIRVPLHYNLFTLSIQEERKPGSDTWLAEGFNRIDELLKWCERANLYVILDLHCAPGGQGRDAKISDYDASKPSLWESPENIRKTIALWGAIAKRYANHEWIAGYDLLNEVNWAFEDGDDPDGCNDQFNQPLKQFYQQTIAAIREYDKNHVLFIQGNCWGSNHNGLWPFDDDNVALSFHHYWVANTVESISKYLELRDTYNIPLWAGEAGESHNQWKAEAVDLFEENDISWCWWTWKKVESTSSAYSIDEPNGYFVLQSYWSELDRFYPNFIERTMMQLAENTLLANTRRNVAMIEAITGHDRSCTEAGYVKIGNAASAKIEAEDFCSMLGVATEVSTDQGVDGNSIGWFERGDWLQYNVEVAEAGQYEARFRVSSVDGHGAFQVILNDGTVLGTVNAIPSTGSWQNWVTVSSELSLPAGRYTLSIQALDFGWNLNWLSFQLL